MFVRYCLDQISYVRLACALNTTMTMWTNHYILKQKDNNRHYDHVVRIPAMVLEGSRLAYFLKRHPNNQFFKLDFHELSRFNDANKVIVFWQYVGNNILTIQTIGNMDLDNPIVIIDDAYEGLLTEKKLAYILDYVKKITDNILICTSNMKLTGQHVQHIDFHIANRYYDNLDIQGDVPTDHSFNRTKKFLCLNNLPRLHRLRMIDFLLEHKIDRHSYISCSKKPVIDIVDDLDNIDDLKNSQITYKNKLQNFKEKGWLGANPINFKLPPESKRRLESNLPLNLDIDDSIRGRVKHFTPKAEEYFNDSYWSIVNERDFFETDFLGYTEKVLKCFYFKHPFVVCGLPYTLQRLHDLGFMTFNHIIDESYDREENNEKRFQMVCEQIQKLNNFNYADHFVLRNKLQPILEYNQKHYIKLNKNFVPNQLITRVLKWYFSE